MHSLDAGAKYSFCLETILLIMQYVMLCFFQGIEAIKQLLVPVSIEEKRKQLREVAIINGTYREIICQNCGEEGHTLYKCPKREVSWKAASLKCSICGGSTHPTIDCPLKRPGNDSTTQCVVSQNVKDLVMFVYFDSLHMILEE